MSLFDRKVKYFVRRQMKKIINLFICIIIFSTAMPGCKAPGYTQAELKYGTYQVEKVFNCKKVRREAQVDFGEERFIENGKTYDRYYLKFPILTATEGVRSFTYTFIVPRGVTKLIL
jgi:hypothetical protein